jgi:acyl-CoA thioesterase YciA
MASGAHKGILRYIVEELGNPEHIERRTMTEASSSSPAKAAKTLEPQSLPTDMDLVLRVMPMPADANGNGDIFGGWIMAQVDLAGAVLPARIAKGRIATVAVNEFVFKQPVSMGDLLSFYARVERIGRTSVTVHVVVYAERNPADPQVVKVTQANLTYVAITKDGQPRDIPKP